MSETGDTGGAPTIFQRVLVSYRAKKENKVQFNYDKLMGMKCLMFKCLKLHLKTAFSITNERKNL